MKNNTISIIIPAYNRHEIFISTVKSVLSQKLGKYKLEIIVVDDGSKPSIRNFLLKNDREILKKLTIISNKNNKGPSESRNVGLKKSKGSYIAFMDSDDYCHPDFLEKLSSKIDKTKNEISISFLQPVFIDQFSFFQELHYLILSLSRFVCFLFMYFFNNHKLEPSFFYMTRLSGMLFTRKSIGKVRFSDKYKLAEDWKFVLDCIKLNKAVIKIFPKFLIDFSYHENSETLGKLGYWNYYYDLINEIPSKMKRSLGIKMFIMYTNLSAYKEKWRKIF